MSTRQADILVQLQENGTPRLDVSVSSTSNPVVSQSFDVAAGLGPFSAGTVIKFTRIEGLSSLPWSAEWTGYLN